jgi:hypothetical protein
MLNAAQLVERRCRPGFLLGSAWGWAGRLSDRQAGRGWGHGRQTWDGNTVRQAGRQAGRRAGRQLRTYSQEGRQAALAYRQAGGDTGEVC